MRAQAHCVNLAAERRLGHRCAFN
eukprot:COSAG06_NODE_57148_length_281_cov_1.109890_1_plen_23_part_10